MIIYPRKIIGMINNNGIIFLAQFTMPGVVITNINVLFAMYVSLHLVFPFNINNPQLYRKDESKNKISLTQYLASRGENI